MVKKKKPKPPNYWTLERIKKSASKYNSVKEWYKNDFDAYAAASRLKALPEITKIMHKEIVANDYWNKKTITHAVKKFSSFKEWHEKDRRSYAAAQRRGLLDDKGVTGHLYKVEGRESKWTKKLIFDDALKYRSRSEWKQRSRQASRMARQLGIFQLAVEHMERVGSKFKRCIYSLEVKDQKIIYYGLTLNFKERISAHLKTKRFQKLIKTYGRKNLLIKQLTDYIPKDDAAELEISLISDARLNGFNVLNKDSGGGLGGSELIWTKEKVFLSAQNFRHKVRWKEAFPSAYSAARKSGYLEEATNHMEILNPKGKWTKELVLEEAKKYKHKSDWQKCSVGSYEAAKNQGLFEEATAHMTRKPIKSKWNKTNVLLEAKKFKYKSDWAKKSSGSYNAAYKNNWIKDAAKHMQNKKAIPVKWTKSKILKDAKKFTRKIDWKRASPGAVAAARKNDLYDEATKHM